MEDLRGREEDRRAGREGGAPAAGGGAVRASEGSGAACVVLNELNRTEEEAVQIGRASCRERVSQLV